MNILIFEDDKQSFDTISQMLTEMVHSCAFCGPISTVADGKQFFKENKERIDLIIADIQLTDGLSFYALTDAPQDVPIIFITSSEEHALKAFEFNSLSYLLKPVSKEKLSEAIEKTQQRLITDENREALKRLLNKRLTYRERFFVKKYNGEKIISLSHVRYIVSEQKTTYVKLHDNSSYELEKSLSAVERELDPEQYMRVNRKYIVPMREIDRIDPFENNKELLILKGKTSPEIIISRESRKKLHTWLGK